MGHTQPKDDEHDDLLPSDDAAESVLSSNEPEPQGIADGEELVLAQLDELHDEGGLDVEAGVEGGLDITTMVDGDDPEEVHDDTRADASFEDASLNDASGIDASGDEDGWISESEGDPELYQSDFSDDEPDHADDGGADGTDDPLHDGIDEDALPPLHSHDADDTLVDEIEQELLREIALDRGIHEARSEPVETEVISPTSDRSPGEAYSLLRRSRAKGEGGESTKGSAGAVAPREYLGLKV